MTGDWLSAIEGPALVDPIRCVMSRVQASGSARSARVDDMRHSAKDRTFKTVRPNQGTASRTVPIRRRQSL
jgi:hypothetical protein